MRQTGITPAAYYHGHGMPSSNNYYDSHHHHHHKEGFGHAINIPSSLPVNLQHRSLSLSDKETGLAPAQPLSMHSDPATSPCQPGESPSPSMASDVSGSGGGQLSSYQLHALRLQEQHEQRSKTQQQQQQQQQQSSIDAKVYPHTHSLLSQHLLATYSLITPTPTPPNFYLSPPPLPLLPDAAAAFEPQASPDLPLVRQRLSGLQHARQRPLQHPPRHHRCRCRHGEQQQCGHNGQWRCWW